jgi:hypothetical protein
MEEIIIKVPEGKVLVSDARCPKGHSLMNPKKLMSGKPAVTCENRLRGKTGLIHFNPYYGIFEYESEIILKPGDIVDLSCPECGVRLMVEELCPVCRVNLFALHLQNGGEVRACPMVGCHNHKLILVDLDAQFAAYYNDERRPKM